MRPRDLRIRFVALATAFTAIFSPPAHANEWVGGKVSVLSDYTSYGSSFGVLVRLVDQEHGPTSAAACTERYRIAVGLANVDENVKNRFFSLLLSAKLAQQKVWLYVDTSAGQNGHCAVQIVAIG